MRSLPTEVQPYHRTVTFTEDSIPKGLLHEHKTKPGTWGVIHVLSGTLRYIPVGTGETVLLTATRPGIIEPDTAHLVAPEGAVSFFVEFWK